MREHRRNAPGHHRALIEEKLGRGPRLPAAERRRAILDTACKVFSERSYRGATTAEIARAAGVSEPVLYRHFPSKTDLYLACLEDVWARLRAAADEAVERTGDPKVAMKVVVEAYMNPQKRVHLVDLWIQSLTEAADDPRIRAYLKRQMREVHDYFAAGLRRWQDNGGLLADRDPDAEAWIFIAGGLLRTIDRRLGGLLGDDIERVKRERMRWLCGDDAPTPPT
jgi:AcrR family transcriptional regulator